MMLKYLTTFGIITALSLGAAQAQTAETEAAPEAEEEAATDPSLGLALGEPEGPQVGQTYVADTFTDWELRCVRSEDGNDPCQLYQLLRDSDGNSVAEINIFAIPEGQRAVAGATLITPLETLLTQQVRLQIDAGEAKRYPFTFCTEVGCISRLGFVEAELNEFKRGASAQITIVPAAAPDRTVDLTMSLSGFTAGFNAVAASQATAE
ncbi:MAG: invasion associated locus B family protein [Pseudomonadota bacterium]